MAAIQAQDDTLEFVWDQEEMPHPMCIPHIVENVLSHLPLKGLRGARLVNAQYNEIASLLLAQRELITFNKKSDIYTYLHLFHPNLQDAAAAAAAAQEGSALAYPAHSRVHFNHDPEENDPEVSPLLESLFTRIGPSLKELRYTTDLIPLNFPKHLPHLRYLWRGLFPALTTLSLEIKWGCPPRLFEAAAAATPRLGTLPSVRKITLDMLITEKDAERASEFLRQLFLATPNLEEISIPGSKKFFDDYINVVLARLILSLELRRLSSLNFCLALNPAEMLDLARKQFPLRCLILDFGEVAHYSSPGNLERCLEVLFSQVAPTLKELHLCFPYSSTHPLHRFVFPQEMKSLRYLALGRFYGSVGILNNLPVIRKLELWNVQFHDFKEKEEDSLFVPVQYLGITSVIS